MIDIVQIGLYDFSCDASDIQVVAHILRWYFSSINMLIWWVSKRLKTQPHWKKCDTFLRNIMIVIKKTQLILFANFEKIVKVVLDR